MAAIESQMPVSQLVDAETKVGVDGLIDTLHEILSRRASLPEIVLKNAACPTAIQRRTFFFLVRAGALFPLLPTSALLEQMMGSLASPAFCFYPGILDGAAGLKFMGIRDAEHNYRPKIY